MIAEHPSVSPEADLEPAGSPGAVELGYQVSLEAFSGPLDLLLYLVRRAEVEIVDIPIATIADQFIATVANWQDIDLEAAGDFILMAATLLEIKSREVMPPAPVESDPAESGTEDLTILDPRANLIKQLLAYRRFKDAGQLIAGLEERQLSCLVRQLHEIIPEDPEEAEGIDLGHCDPAQLFSQWEGVMAKIAGLGPRTVINDDVPMEARINALLDIMRLARSANLSWLFERAQGRLAQVGTLMATLECARQRFIEAIQHEQYGEVMLHYREDRENVSQAMPPAAEAVEPPRRRRRLPLMTWQGPEPANVQSEEETAEPDTELEPESDEQRFLRELEEACRVDAILGRCLDLEASFAAFQAQHQALEATASPAEPTDVATAGVP